MEWIAAEWPPPDIRIIERADEIAWSILLTRAKPSTGQSFSRTSFSSGCTRSTGVTRILASGGAETRLARNDAGVLADHRRVEAVLGEQQLAQHLRSRSGVQTCAPSAFIAASKRVGDRREGQHRGFIGAEDGIVEGFRGDDALGRELQVGAVVDQHRRIAGPDPDSRIAGAIGRLDDRRSAGRDDEIDAFVADDLLDQRDARFVQHLDDAVRRAGRLRRLGQGARGIRRSRPWRPGCGLRMIALRVIKARSVLKIDRGDRIGDRDQRKDDAGRARQLDDLPGRVDAWRYEVFAA